MLLRVEYGSHRKLERGAASGSLHRLVRPFPGSMACELMVVELAYDMPIASKMHFHRAPPRSTKAAVIKGRVGRAVTSNPERIADQPANLRLAHTVGDAAEVLYRACMPEGEEAANTDEQDKSGEREGGSLCHRMRRIRRPNENKISHRANYKWRS